MDHKRTLLLTPPHLYALLAVSSEPPLLPRLLAELPLLEHRYAHCWDILQQVLALAMVVHLRCFVEVFCRALNPLRISVRLTTMVFVLTEAALRQVHFRLHLLSWAQHPVFVPVFQYPPMRAE